MSSDLMQRSDIRALDEAKTTENNPTIIYNQRSWVRL